MAEPSNPDDKWIWITGARGLIGNCLVQQALSFRRDGKLTAIVRPQQGASLASHELALDLEDFATVAGAFRSRPPSLIIHCAAMSRSPDCQANPARAKAINVDATRVLAELAAEIPFFFFSTDLVFDGEKGGYLETDVPNPRSVYGETKAEAERLVLRNPLHTVIRTSLNGGQSPAGNRGFNEELRLAWRASRDVRLFRDEYRCPIPAVMTARAVLELAARNSKGVYHVAGAERLSRLEIGELVAERCPELTPEIIPTSLKEYHGAPRPPDVSLDCSKAQALLSFRLPGLREWLRENPEAFF